MLSPNHLVNFVHTSTTSLWYYVEADAQYQADCRVPAHVGRGACVSRIDRSKKRPKTGFKSIVASAHARISPRACGSRRKKRRPFRRTSTFIFKSNFGLRTENTRCRRATHLAIHCEGFIIRCSFSIGCTLDAPVDKVNMSQSNHSAEGTLTRMKESWMSGCLCLLLERLLGFPA